MKKFIIKCICFALILGIIFVPFAVIADPYNIFHVNHPKNNGVEPNKNYMKMHNVLTHPDKYDSFLFGSSRVGFIGMILRPAKISLFSLKVAPIIQRRGYTMKMPTTIRTM